MPNLPWQKKDGSKKEKALKKNQEKSKPMKVKPTRNGARPPQPSGSGGSLGLQQMDARSALPNVAPDAARRENEHKHNINLANAERAKQPGPNFSLDDRAGSKTDSASSRWFALNPDHPHQGRR